MIKDSNQRQENKNRKYHSAVRAETIGCFVKTID